MRRTCSSIKMRGGVLNIRIVFRIYGFLKSLDATKLMPGDEGNESHESNAVRKLVRIPRLCFVRMTPGISYVALGSQRRLTSRFTTCLWSELHVVCRR